MKRTALLLTALLLTACGEGSSSTASCDQDFWNEVVGTCLPANWTVLDAETLRQRGVPEETIVGFQLSEAVSGQFPTVAITEEKLPSAFQPLQYSEANIRSVGALAGYEQIDVKDFTVDGEQVKLHIFSGQPIENEPGRRFYQVSTAKGEKGYTITAVTPMSIDSSLESSVMLMLEHFTLEAPTEEE